MGRQPASKCRQNSTRIPGAEALQDSWPCASLSNTINLLGPISRCEAETDFYLFCFLSRPSLVARRCACQGIQRGSWDSSRKEFVLLNSVSLWLHSDFATGVNKLATTWKSCEICCSILSNGEAGLATIIKPAFVIFIF